MIRPLLAVLFALPTFALAWDPVNPNNTAEGIQAVATITDVATASDRSYLGLAGADVAVGCRQVTGRAPGEAVGDLLHAGRFVPIGEDERVGAALLPIVFFARAHNVRVLIRLVAFNGTCTVAEVRTCFEPASCP